MYILSIEESWFLYQAFHLSMAFEVNLGLCRLILRWWWRSRYLQGLWCGSEVDPCVSLYLSLPLQGVLVHFSVTVTITKTKIHLGLCGMYFQSRIHCWGKLGQRTWEQEAWRTVRVGGMEDSWGRRYRGQPGQGTWEQEAWRNAVHTLACSARCFYIA